MQSLHLGNHARSWRSGLLAALLSLGLSGCGAGAGDVSGTVRYRGKALTQGTIQFLGRDGIPRAATIAADGSYALTMPAGDTKVIVTSVDEERMRRFTTTLSGRGGRVASPTLPTQGLSRIPQRYADWDASGLTILVVSGKNDNDVTLRD